MRHAQIEKQSNEQKKTVYELKGTPQEIIDQWAEIAKTKHNGRIFGAPIDGRGERFYIEEGRIKVNLSPYDDMLKKYSDLDIPYFDVPGGKEFFLAELEGFKSRQEPFATKEQIDHIIGLIGSGNFEVHSYAKGKRKHALGFDVGL